MERRMVRFVVVRLLAALALIAVPLLVLALNGSASRERPEPPPEDEQQIEKLIRELDSEDEVLRFRAEERLIDLARRDERVIPLLERELAAAAGPLHARITQTLHNIAVCKKNGA